MKKVMMPEKFTLNKDFRRLYGRGRSYVSAGLVTYVLTNKSGKIRYGVTTGKKVGCAVKRNRARRIIEAAFSTCIPCLQGKGLDIVFVARTRTPSLKTQDIQRAMKKHFISDGIWSSEK